MRQPAVRGAMRRSNGEAAMTPLSIGTGTGWLRRPHLTGLGGRDW
jgi:hypothetical protein